MDMAVINSNLQFSLILLAFSNSIIAFPNSLSNYEVTEESTFGSEPPYEPNNIEHNVSEQKPSSEQPVNYGNPIPQQNFGSKLNNFFKKVFQNVPGNTLLKNDELFQDKLRTLLGNRHIYLELLHQFSPHPWFKPFYDKFQAIQEILRDPNFTQSQDKPSGGNSFGCGCFPNLPGPFNNGIFPQKDEGNVDNANSTGSSNNRASSEGSKFFAFGSRPAPPYNFNGSLRKNR